MRERKTDNPLALSPLDLAKRVEVTGERLKRVEDIPLTRIVEEPLPEDDPHAYDMGMEVLYGKWGQTQTIEVRCRRGGNTLDEVVYDIADGFHRTKGLKLVKKDWKEIGLGINATVLYGCTDEDLMDRRILAANSVKSLKFARKAIWIKAAWNLTPWKDKISVAQAFGIVANNSSGRILGINPEELDQVREWVNGKTRKWLSTAGSIYQDLRIVEAIAPDLALKVRSGSFGKGQLALTPNQAAILADLIPGEHQLQRRVAKYATAEGLSTNDIKALTEKLAKEDLNEQQLEQVFKPDKWKDAGDGIYTVSRTRFDAKEVREPKHYKLKQLKIALHNHRRCVELSEEIKPKTKRFILSKIKEILDGLK